LLGHGQEVQVSKGFGLVVRFTLAEGATERFDALTEETLAQIRANEPGTLVYNSHRVDGSPQQRIFYELYADRAAFDAHEEQPYVKHFLAEREQYLTNLEVDFLELVDAKSAVGEDQA
jgi:quinol monooxygenase YgiN